jgi:hypothetical protein
LNIVAPDRLANKTLNSLRESVRKGYWWKYTAGNKLREWDQAQHFRQTQICDQQSESWLTFQISSLFVSNLIFHHQFLEAEAFQFYWSLAPGCCRACMTNNHFLLNLNSFWFPHALPASSEGKCCFKWPR